MPYIKEDEYVPGAWNAICDRCGRKRKSTEMRKTWQGYYVCYPEHYEERHPQDFVRARVEKTAPDWIRPPGEDIHTTDACPTIFLSTASLVATPGVPVTIAYAALGVLSARTYTLRGPAGAVMTPASVVIEPGKTRGSVTVTFSLSGEARVAFESTTCASSELVFTVTGGAAPTPGFYALINSATPIYQRYNVFDPGAGGAYLSPIEYPITDETVSQNFLPESGCGTPQTWESFPGAVLAALSLPYTDMAADATVTVTAASGAVVNIPPGTTDSQGRFSVAWFNGSSYLPADGGSKVLNVQTNGQTVTFQMSKGVATFGAYLVDYLDFGGTCTWAFYNGPTLVQSEVVNPSVFTPGDSMLNGSVGFVGFTALSIGAVFDRVTFTFTATASDVTGFDNIFVGALQQTAVIPLEVGQEIRFFDTSVGATSWLWNFGDGTTSTLQNPTKTYTTPGLRSVTLTLNGGAATLTRTDYIAVA